MKDNTKSLIEHKPNCIGSVGYAIYAQGRQVRLQELVNSLENKRHEYGLLLSNTVRKANEIKDTERQIRELKKILED